MRLIHFLYHQRQEFINLREYALLNLVSWVYFSMLKIQSHKHLKVVFDLSVARLSVSCLVCILFSRNYDTTLLLASMFERATRVDTALKMGIVLWLHVNWSDLSNFCIHRHCFDILFQRVAGEDFLLLVIQERWVLMTVPYCSSRSNFSPRGSALLLCLCHCQTGQLGSANANWDVGVQIWQSLSACSCQVKHQKAKRNSSDRNIKCLSWKF